MKLKLFKTGLMWQKKIPGCTETTFEIMNSIISEVTMEGYFSLTSLHGMQIKLVIKNINELIYEELFQIQFCKNLPLVVASSCLFVGFVLFCLIGQVKCFQILQ